MPQIPIRSALLFFTLSEMTQGNPTIPNHASVPQDKHIQHPTQQTKHSTAIKQTIKTDPQLEIGGLVVDQTLSRVGHLFYEELLNGWDIPKDMPTITIRERPDNITGNTIWIDVDDNIIFEDKVGSRPSGIEEKAQSARAALDIYLQQHKDALRGLEGF